MAFVFDFLLFTLAFLGSESTARELTLMTGAGAMAPTKPVFDLSETTGEVTETNSSELSVYASIVSVSNGGLKG